MTSDFKMNLLDIQQEVLNIPDMEYDATIRMLSRDFLEICRNLRKFGDCVKVLVTKEGLSFDMTGEIGKTNIKVKSTNGNDSQMDDGAALEIVNISKPVEMTFSLPYLNDFAKAEKTSEYVTLKMTENFPLVVEYEFKNREGDASGSISYYLAPRIADG